MATAAAAVRPGARGDTGPPPLSHAVKLGLLAGTIAVYLAATGILERFDERDLIIDIVSLAYTMLVLAVLTMAYQAANDRSPRERVPASFALPRGVITGAVAGAMTGLFVLFFETLRDSGVNPREVFNSISPALLEEVLLFGKGTATALLYLVGGFAFVGLVGASVRLLTVRYRKPLFMGLLLVIFMSLGEPLVGPILNGLQEKIPVFLGLDLGKLFDSGWLYEGGGLTVLGAIVTFLVTVAVGEVLEGRSRRDARRFDPAAAIIQERRKGFDTKRAIGFGLLLVGVILLPIIVEGFVSSVLGIVGLYVLLALGLNIVVGYAGLLDLGYVAFFAIGAYAAGILTSLASFLVREEGQALATAGFTNFWVALPLVVIIAVVLGVAIGAPVLRLRGDYLAIVTLGFGEIIRTLVQSDWLKPWLGGAQGIIRIPTPPPESWDLKDPERIFYLIVAFCLVAVFISYQLADSRVGRAWVAMREDEEVAEAMGISVIKYKLLAFAIGAGIACLGGAFFAIKLGSIFPNSFHLLVSINVLAVIVLGGMGSIKGVFLGAFVLVGVPELLREFGEYRLLIYGIVLVAIMLVRPEGLIPSARRRLELHEEDAPESQVEHAVSTDKAPHVRTDPA
jgi:branched-chain amino acid transport system permease protein